MFVVVSHSFKLADVSPAAGQVVFGPFDTLDEAFTFAETLPDESMAMVSEVWDAKKVDKFLPFLTFSA